MRCARARAAAATHGESAAVRCDVVRAKSTVVAETRRSRRTCVVAQRPRRLGATTVEAQWRVAWRSGTEEYGTTGYWIGSERQLVLEIAATAMATTTTEATTTSTKVRSWLRGRMSEISHATACVVRAAVALCLVVCVLAAVGIS